jgi:hypothetical protein
MRLDRSILGNAQHLVSGMQAVAKTIFLVETTTRGVSGYPVTEAYPGGLPHLSLESQSQTGKLTTGTLREKSDSLRSCQDLYRRSVIIWVVPSFKLVQL